MISRIKSLELRTQVLVLTSQSAEAFCKRCIQVGARGFVNKEEDLNNLINALNAVIAGYTFFPSLTFDTLGTPPERISESELIGLLSDREMIVLQHLAMGYSNKAIGEKLFLSNKTVSTYKTRLLQARPGFAGRPRGVRQAQFADPLTWRLAVEAQAQGTFGQARPEAAPATRRASADFHKACGTACG